MPQFQELYEEYGTRGFQILAITREDREVVDSFLQGKPYTFPVLLDPEGVVSETYGVSALPTTVLVSPTGTVTRMRRGLDPFMERWVRRAMGDAPDVPDPLDVLDSLMAPPLEGVSDTSEAEALADTLGTTADPDTFGTTADPDTLGPTPGPDTLIRGPTLGAARQGGGDDG
jgi:hypothetical protein